MNVCILQPAYSNIQIEASLLVPAGVQLCTARIEPGQPLPAELINAHVLMVRDAALSASVIANLAKCRAVIRYGVGYNTVDLQALNAHNIMLCNVPDYDTDEVSTHAMAMYLALRRRLVTRNRAVRKGIWAVDDKEPMYSPRQSTLGLIGFGRIARRLLEKLRGFEPGQILVFDPFIDADTLASYGAQQSSVADICAQASLISLHVPYNSETHHIIGSKELRSMRSDCILINTSRGGLIDEAALNEALAAQQIAGAGLDVFEQEPVNKDSPLFQRDNLIASDHCGWYSESSMTDLRTKAAEEALRVLQGQAPRSCVNSAALAARQQEV